MMMMRPNGAVQTMTDAMYDAAGECSICEKKFHAFRRKHRCRACGNAVCGSCARSHKVMPSATLVRYNNEPVRVCDRCIQDQNQMLMERRRAEDIERTRARQQAVAEEEQRMRAAEQMRREQERAEQIAREKSRQEMRLRALEEKHLGPRPDRSKLRRCRSVDDCGRDPMALYTKEIDLFIEDAEKRSYELVGELAGATATATTASSMENGGVTTTVVQEAEECAICLDTMDVGNAIYTTACGHSFHWSCLKEIQRSDSSNYDKCPSCRSTMAEMQVRKQCDHPRVRVGHRFCRDCGSAVTERDVKTRPTEPSLSMSSSAPSQANQPVSYRASSHGALVRCPQCHIQMRVLPHMYNMRVACPSGHMFLVQVAGQQGGMGRGGGMGFGGMRGPPRGMNMGYPGSSYYRAANSYSEL